uniref:MBD domain-containing protein n=1 Tax=Kryptolebias marmoratus TaxID=37003 RepID=A0A3Q3EJ39_KRYMA
MRSESAVSERDSFPRVKRFYFSFQKARKKQAGASLASNSESGTSSDSSSDGSLSSDLEDLAEDDEDDDEDEDDEEEDKQSELSDSEKRTKKKAKVNNSCCLVASMILTWFCPPSPLSPLSPQTLMSQAQMFPAEQKKQQQGPNKSPKRTSLSSPAPLPPAPLPPAPLPPAPLPPAPPLPPQNNHSNLFLSSALLGLPEPPHPNGVIQTTTQDAPLALITKPRKDPASRGRSPQPTADAGSMPVNLSTGAGRTQAGAQAAPPPTTSPHAAGHGSRKTRTPRSKGQTPGPGQVDPLAAWKGFSQNHLVQSLVELFRGGESVGIPGVSIPGVGIPGVGIPGTCNPTAALPANKESDDSGDEDDDDEDDDLEEEDEEDSDDSLSGLGKRKRVMDEKELTAPLELGWRRETRIKSLAGRPQGEVAYYAPCGKKLRQYPDVMKYLSRNGISGITRDNFSFSAKIRVGDFYEAREGPQGLQWTLLKDDEVVPRILAMEGRRGRPPNSERHQAGDGAKGSRRRKGRPPNVGDALAPEGVPFFLLYAEIARQAAQMKLMRKLEKQALARAAKEARRQQGEGRGFKASR